MTGRPSKSEIANKLRQAGAMLRFRGENVHRARAYEAGAEAIESATEDLAVLVAEDRLTDLPGIGASLAATVTELFRDRRSSALDRIMGSLPEALLALVDVPGFTSRRIRLLHEELGVETVEDVRAALASGSASTIHGFGAKVTDTLLATLNRATVAPSRVLLGEAQAWAERLASHLRESGAARTVVVAGSIRRSVETVGDLNLVAASEQPAEVVAAFVGYPAVATVASRGPDQAVIRLGNGMRATLEVVAPAGFGVGLIRATGSAAHLASLTQWAAERGVDLGSLPGADEAEIYRALGLPSIPPELREGRDEIDLAAGGDNFSDLVTFADLRGVVHCHSVYSDGRDTIGDMASAVAALGLSYLTMTDHSPTASYAGGLSADRVREQAVEIAALGPSVATRVLRGAECDILKDGTLDHDDQTRAGLEVVIASIHERHQMDSAAMTDRLIRALSGPRFKIWGHPLGRLLLRRPPIACDFERVLDAVANAPAAIEVNGSPYRMDLPAELIPAARRRGIKFVISADAHSVSDLDNLHTGITVARRGGLRRGEILNALDADAFASAVGPARKAWS